MKDLINGIFDFHELGRKSLGSTTFRSLTSDQQQRFVAAFKEMIENSSLKKLEVYKSDSTIYDKPVYRKDKVTITAHTFFEGQESVLVYKMLLKNQRWRTWDLIIDDLSTYRNYREQFKRILKTKNIEELIKLLKDKAREAEKEDKADPGKEKDNSTTGSGDKK